MVAVLCRRGRARLELSIPLLDFLCHQPAFLQANILSLEPEHPHIS